MILEIAQQESTLGVFFDTLVICSVTGSSHAGCIVGAVAEGRKRRVIGIDASAKPEATRAQVLRIAKNTAELLDPELEIRDEDVVLDERFHAGVYGIPDEGTIDAMKCEFKRTSRQPNEAGCRRMKGAIGRDSAEEESEGFGLTTSGGFYRLHDHRPGLRREINGGYDPAHQGRRDKGRVECLVHPPRWSTSIERL